MCTCKFHNVRFDMQGKDATNAKNHYNQNFKGLYCTCHRPYPDPEDEVQKQSNDVYTSQHEEYFSVRKDNSVLSIVVSKEGHIFVLVLQLHMYGALQKKQVLWLKCLLVLDINKLYLFNLQKNYKYKDLSVSLIPENYY